MSERPSKRNMTIYDVAKKAGVSIATVSRAFSGKGYVSEATKEKIMQACDGYRPNAYATQMQSKKSHTIGILLSHGANYFFFNSVYNEAMVGVCEVTKENGYHLLLDMDIESEDPCRLYLEGRVDGYILMGIQENSPLIARMQEFDIPFVVIGNYNGECPGVAHVDINDRKAIYEAVSYLIRLGHTDIGIITGNTQFASCYDRLEGYKDALKAEGIEVLQENIEICDNMTETKAFNLTKKLLLKRKPITALIAFNDQVAVAAYNAAQDLGIKIPEELSIIGFDDSSISKYVSPKLTTIWQPSYEKGEKAARMLIDALKENKQPHEGITLDCMMIYRNSCSAPGKKLSE